MRTDRLASRRGSELWVAGTLVRGGGAVVRHRRRRRRVFRGAALVRMPGASTSSGGRARLALSFGLTNMSTQLTSVVESPHVIVGAAAGGLPQASAALRTYLIQGIRDGRGFSPLVTYNTWFADGTRIDDRTLRDQMQRVAALGTELFVLDAGWYAGAGAENVFDFHSGLGRWQADPQRFPEGLHALTDYAHELGHEVRRVGRARTRQPGCARRGRARLVVARDSRRPAVERSDGANLSGRSGRARLGLAAADVVHRSGASGLPEVG